jgi:hypothetical protein
MKTIGATLVEALCIGAVLAVAMYIAISNRAAWMVALDSVPLGAPSAALAGLVVGALFHIVCEVSGLNEWYAKTYFD